MSNQSQKRKPFAVDRPARAKRRRTPRTVEHTYLLESESGERITRKHESERTPDDSEARQVLAQAAQSFIATVEFYKTEAGGAKSHTDAVKEALQCHERRRGYVEGLSLEEVNWGQLAAVAEVNTDDALDLWRRVREAADDELPPGTGPFTAWDLQMTPKSCLSKSC